MYWRRKELVGCDYATREEHPLTNRALTVLAAASNWTSASDFRRELPHVSPSELNRLVRGLRTWQFLEASDEPVHPIRSKIRAWDTWMPEAAFFHFATKDGRRASFADTVRQARRRLETEDFPDVLKIDPRARRRSLPPFRRAGRFPEVLLARRSWRRFGDRPLTLPQLSTLLGLTWAVQRWARVSSEIRVALKTSPSPGACHSTEVYVVARRVTGLPPGVYHYCPDAHDLEVVRAGLPRDPIVTYLGGQPWFAGASALFLMTSVLPRVQWKYRFPRAYRAVLLEAGHFCQTFCLTATWLGLAPFCTGVFADSVIERGLRIDGVGEAIVYAAGVGARPAGTAWAPWPAAKATPTTEAPSYAKRRR